ncbi:hypothetical protein CsSME_00053990 [Camellia sinensis var. sinensis]
MPNWELKKCCNHEQVVFLSTISICTVVILALWRTILLLPFKLVTVFLHEASHAIACKLTCGHVEAIQVNADEGGFTQTRGGVYWVILPAGCCPLLIPDKFSFYCQNAKLLFSCDKMHFWNMPSILDFHVTEL